MSTKGFLTDFSLQEIFQFIDRGHKTGLLSVQSEPISQTKQPSVYYIWVYQGHIVAAANRLDQQGLVELIEQCHMLSDSLRDSFAGRSPAALTRAFDKLLHWCCPIDEPLGLYLKNQGVLTAEQLKQLFQIQVLQPIYTLFQLKEGEFKFDQNVPMPTREMTGLSVPAVVLNQYALIKVLLDEIDNNCLNLKSLPCWQLNEVPLYPVFCFLYSRPCDRKTCPKDPHHQPQIRLNDSSSVTSTAP